LLKQVAGNLELFVNSNGWNRFIKQYANRYQREREEMEKELQNKRIKVLMKK
jgi:hypothetical protein